MSQTFMNQVWFGTSFFKDSSLAQLSSHWCSIFIRLQKTEGKILWWHVLSYAKTISCDNRRNKRNNCEGVQPFKLILPCKFSSLVWSSVSFSVSSVWHQMFVPFILMVISRLHVSSPEVLRLVKKVENVMRKYFSYWVLNFLNKAVGVKIAW